MALKGDRTEDYIEDSRKGHSGVIKCKRGENKRQDDKRSDNFFLSMTSGETHPSRVHFFSVTILS